jgi:hypothetical protein
MKKYLKMEFENWSLRRLLAFDEKIKPYNYRKVPCNVSKQRLSKLLPIVNSINLNLNNK